MNAPWKSHRTIWAPLALLASLTGMFGCDRTVDHGGSGDETSTVAFYRPDGKPAARATVSLYGSADTGVEPRKQVVTDENGQAAIPTPAKGFYNLVVRGREGLAVFQDSLFSDGANLPVYSDTLQSTGVLIGRVRVQPQHSPRIAWVHLLGAGKYLNVDDSGFFRMEGVPQGTFTMAALTREDGYTPTFKDVRAVSDSLVDLGTIELVYTGLPVIENLEARFDTLTGLVHLRWDSVALRQNWRYNIYRDGILLGQTIGPRWIDTVSDELPLDAPAQGKHTYLVRLANADSVGPKWESITMQVISPILYEEIKFDWQKLSDLPWKGGLYRIDTSGSELFCWRSLEYETNRGERYTYHMGWIQQWVSKDSGRTWRLLADSLDLGALPVRFGDKWWSVLCPRTQEATSTRDTFWYPSHFGVKYNQVTIVSSSGGGKWDTLETIPLSYPLTTWHFELVPGTIELVGGCTGAESCLQKELGFSSATYQDRLRWKLSASSFSPTEVLRYPNMTMGVGLTKKYWSDLQWWSISALASYQSLNGSTLPSKFVGGNGEELSLRGALMGYHVFQEGDNVLEFGYRWALSMDSRMRSFHAIKWPAAGPHYELRHGGGFLSASDAGIWFGRILPYEAHDSLGTWVKQTEIQAVY